MAKAKTTPHQITIVAYGSDAGCRVVVDIVETSLRHAPFFARSFYRNPNVVALSASRPGTPWDQRKIQTIAKGAQ